MSLTQERSKDVLSTVGPLRIPRAPKDTSLTANWATLVK